MAIRTIIRGERVGKLMHLVHKNAMKTLDRHAPSDPKLAAIVMEAYEEFLATDFREQMTKKYGIQYPLNLEFKNIFKD
jgi:hypothetical protein